MEIRLKRVYEEPGEEDGLRILVDRLWPRGLNKDAAKIDLWLKEVAPSDALRKWFGHAPEKWPGFCERYFRELDSRHPEIEQLLEYAAEGRVTLLFGARDERFNNAVALRDFLNLKAIHS